ncbi:MAG TPA: glycosyltransferase [Acidobacteriota bacterium]|nr:glycosyltransferase [Acidobacteriota bacterium]
MTTHIRQQGTGHILFYMLFALIGFFIIMYYLSDTLIHYTNDQQFPINSFHRFPLTFLIFPAELFSFVFSAYFVYTLLVGNTIKNTISPLPNRNTARVAILIPVYHEPKEIVSRTIEACQQLKWTAGVKIYLLDDSTNPDDKASMQRLANKYGINLVRRTDRAGYKAGNLNNALKNHVTEKYFAVFDSDQAPLPQFLEETMDYFSDPEVAFVQTPQHFVNTDSPIEKAQQLGNNIFYQAQCVCKAHDKAMPFCGTNVIVRTDVFKLVKGFAYYTATEDIELGMRMNEAGYHGAFVPKILVHGYATTHFNAYASQQYRWANGNLAILRKNWLKICLGRFNMLQQIHFMFTLGWWLMGIVNIVYILVPILSLFLGGTHHSWLPPVVIFLLFFNVVIGVSMIYAALNNRADEKVTFTDAFLQYSLLTNSMFIYAWAAVNALLGRYVGFVRTSKTHQQTGIWQVKWNILLAVVCYVFSIFALYKAVTAADIDHLRGYLPISLWLLFYTAILSSSIFFVGKSHTDSANETAHNAKVITAETQSATARQRALFAQRKSA